MKVYVCAPLNAKSQKAIERNIEFAERCGDVIRHLNMTPVVPHVLAKFFDDNNKAERDMCYSKALSALDKCDAMVYLKKRVTKGMKGEINRCKLLEIPYYEFEDVKELSEIMFNMTLGGDNGGDK